MVMSEFSI